MKLFWISLFIFITSVVYCSNHPLYQQLRIYVTDKSVLERVFDCGIDPEGTTGSIGGWMEFITDNYARQQLTKNGIMFSVVVEDLENFSAAQLHKGTMNALGFGQGSMGGYYTYTEMIQQLDSMHILFPNYISERESIGTSNEGRALWAVKISDNPGIHEANEPEVLYTAIHHAREPEGLMVVMYYMWWLLENHENNTMANYLIHNRQLWFIPIVNPDGYVYNQTTNPGGGGMWRKNRKNNNDTYFGVDLNRNYGPYYMWNSENNGSSTSTNNDTYRGPAPFSEPEVAAIDRFMRAHVIRTALNYHTFGNYLIYPYGYTNQETMDSVLYREFAFDMTATNRYHLGTDQQTVRYGTRGTSDDYMFGDITKPQTFAMTPEVGPTFWPPSTSILPLAQENLNSNLHIAMVAGMYPVLHYIDIQDQNSDGVLLPGESFTLQVYARNKGLEDSYNLNVRVSGNPSIFEWIVDSTMIEYLPTTGKLSAELSGRMKSNFTGGVPTPLIFTFSDTSGYLRYDTVSVIPGTSTILLADDGTTMNNWVSNGWGIANQGFNSLQSLADSPEGDYPANSDLRLILNHPIQTSGFDKVILSFRTKWAIEPSYDIGVVELSTDSSVWRILKSSISRKATGSGKQFIGLWGYDAYSPGMDWIYQEIDLSLYVNNPLWLRFRLSSDGGAERDGMFIDDITVRGYHTTTLGVGTLSYDIPNNFSLTQNYPNPFNPTTTMNLQMGKSGFVRLVVYDITGKVISTLMNEERQPGTYTVSFDGSHLNSGIYFAEVEVTGTGNEVIYQNRQKLVLMK